MLETITFPVAHCPRCGRDVLVGYGAAEAGDDADEVVAQCTRCGDPLGDDGRRRYSAASLSALGYEIDGVGEGCGTGGCGSCGSGATTTRS